MEACSKDNLGMFRFGSIYSRAFWNSVFQTKKFPFKTQLYMLDVVSWWGQKIERTLIVLFFSCGVAEIIVFDRLGTGRGNEK